MAAQIPVVRVERLTFSYDGSTDVLHELTVTLTPGDFLVVLGANGAGKSTLCYLLSGIIPHIYAGRRRGAVLVDGLDPWEHPMYAIAGHAGIVLQDPETQLFMPNLEMELGFGPANLGVPREEIRQRTERFLHLVGLDGFQRRSSKALSGGQKQRAALASVLTMLPRVLVLDEPTSQLDPVGSQEVVAALRNLARSRETTVVMTTHKVDEVVGIATHCLVLREGHAVRQGAFEEVVQDVDTLEEAGVQAPASYRVRRLLGRAAGEARLAGAATVTETAWVGDTATVTDTPRPGTADAAGVAEPVVRVEQLEVVYPGLPPVRALADIDLEIRAGEFVGVVGQNGSGKTTLAKTLVGLVRPARGRVWYQGKDITHRRAGEIARHIGLVLQNPDFQLFNISVEEEVAFALKNMRLPPDQIRARVQEVLSGLGMEKVRDLFPFKLSFGDRRKLSVAAVLAMDPQVLILDEPTTAQDYRGRYLLAELADRLRITQGRTIVMITHDMDLVARYATRLVVMHEGRILADGPTAEVFARTELLARAWLRPPTAALLAREMGLPEDIITTEQLLAHLAVGRSSR